LAIALFLSTSVPAAPVLRNTFPAVDDAHVKSGSSAKKNFGQEPTLELQTSGKAVSESLLKFDLAGVEEGFKDVRLRVYGFADKDEPVTILVRSTATASWLESAVTWKDKPEHLSTIGSIQVSGVSPVWYELDITTFVKAQLAARQPMISLALLAADSPNSRIFIRAHEAESNGPEIVTSRPLFSAKVVFQPKEKVASAGYFIDSGALFGPQANSGFRFGWSVDVSQFVKDRNNPEKDDPKPAKGPDARYMGVAFMDHPDMAQSAVWEIAVPNGKYKVHLVAGDASYDDSIYSVNLEGVLTADGIPDGTKRWIEGSQIVTVTDGRLTVSNGNKGINNKLSFLEIAEIAELK